MIGSIQEELINKAYRMAESTTTCSVMARAKSDVSAMKDTLRAQQQLLQKLYLELDEEREASATATCEAMDMILRLQGEKARVEMEASHYKRMAEEKIGHAEATIEAFQELVQQKEVEISSLESQLQAYKHKLVSLGCDDLNVSDQSTTEVRRQHSMPPIAFKASFRVPLGKRERSPSPPCLDLARKTVVDSVYGSGNLDSYWNQIKMLDEQARVISDCDNNVGEKSTKLSSRRACSMFSQATCGQKDRLDSTNSADHPNVHDVFEVPQTGGKNEVGDDDGRRRVENRLTKPESVFVGMVESQVVEHHDVEKQKGMVKDVVSMTGKKKERMDVDWGFQREFQKLHQRILRLERERISSTRHEITREGDGEEQLRLLKDIQSQLKVMQSEMRSWKTEKGTPMEDDVSLGSLQEVKYIELVWIIFCICTYNISFLTTSFLYNSYSWCKRIFPLSYKLKNQFLHFNFF